MALLLGACGSPAGPDTAQQRRASSTYPPSYDEYVAYADNSMLVGDSAGLQKHVAVRRSGALGVEGTLADGVRLSVGAWANVGGSMGGYLLGDTAVFRYGTYFGQAHVGSTVLDQHSAGYVSTHDFPSAMPSFPRARPAVPGSTPIAVAASSTVTVTSTVGISTITIGAAGVLQLQAGRYEVESIELAEAANIRALGAVELLVANHIAGADRSRLSVASGLTANELRVEVFGGNGGSGLLEEPLAVSFGASANLRALVLAPHGTLRLGAFTQGLGAFVARDIAVGAQAGLQFEDGVAALSGSSPLVSADVYEVAEDQTLTVGGEGVLYNDLDPAYQTLTATLAAGPSHGALSLAADGSFAYTPDGNFTGTDSFTYRASNGSATSATALVTITVDATNDVPNIVSTASPQAFVGQMWRYAVVVEDPDQGDAATVTLVSPPPGMSIDAQGVVSWMPSQAQLGPQSFQIVATDTSSTADTQSVTVTVLGTPASEGFSAYAEHSILVDDDAVVFDGSVGVYATGAGGPFVGGSARAFVDNAAVVGKVSGADLFADSVYLDTGAHARDVYATTLNNNNGTYLAQASLPAMPALATVASLQVGTGTITVSGGGYEHTITPTQAYAFVVSSGARLLLQPGVYEVMNVTLGPDAALAALGPVELRIANHLELGAGAFVGPAEDAIVGTHQIRIDVHGLQASMGDPLSTPFAVNTGVASSITGTLVVPNGTAKLGFLSVNWGHFAARDLIIGASSVMFLGESVPENQPPVIVSNPVVQTPEDEEYVYVVAINDADLQDTWTYALDDGPASMQIDSAGVIRWTPGNADVGSHPVTVRVTDSAEAFDTQSFTLTVLNVNDAPAFVAFPSTLGATEDQPFTVDIDADDIDVGDTLTFSLLAPIPAGMGIDSGTGVIQWTPDQASIDGSPYPVTVRVTDGTAVADAAFALTVAEVNDAPVFAAVGAQTATEDVVYSLTIQATDPENDVLTYGFGAERPYGMTIDASTGLIQWTPRNSQVGAQLVEVVASDGQLEDRVTFTVDVANVNDPPEIYSTPGLFAPVGQAYVYDVLARDQDAQDSLSYAVTPGSLSISASGQIQWTPQALDVGSHGVTVVVSDLAGATDTQTFTLVVQAASPPVAAFRTARDGRAVSYAEDGGHVVSVTSETTSSNPAAVLNASDVSGGLWAVASGVAFPQSMVVELANGGTYVIDRVELGAGGGEFEVWVSDTDTAPESFSRAFQGPVGSFHRQSHPFDPVRARFVELRLLSPVPGFQYANVTRFAVFEQAHEGGIVSLKAGGAVASASSGTSTQDHAIDHASSVWSPGSVGSTLDITLVGTTAHLVDQVNVWAGTSGLQDFDVAVAETEGGPFTTVVSGSLTDSTKPHWFTFPATLARQVRLTTNSAVSTNPTVAALDVYASQRGGLIATFHDQSSDPDDDIREWRWDFGDGGSSFRRDPTHSYSAAGTYLVRLTVIDALGQSDTFEAPYTAVAPPAIAFHWSPLDPQEDDFTFAVVDDTATTPLEKTATVGSLSLTYPGASPSINFGGQDSGPTLVELEHVDGNLISTRLQKTVSIANVAPTVNAGLDTTLYWGERWTTSAVVHDPSAADRAALECEWVFGDSTIQRIMPCYVAATTMQATTSYGAPGIYDAVLLVRDMDGAETTDTVRVTVTQRPTALYIEGAENPDSGGNADVVVWVVDGYDAAQPMVGRTVTFALGAQVVTAQVDAMGRARGRLNFSFAAPSRVSVRAASTAQYLEATTSADFQPGTASTSPTLTPSVTVSSDSGRRIIAALPRDLTAFFVDPRRRVVIEVSSEQPTVAVVAVPGLGLPERAVNVAPGVPAVVELPREVFAVARGTIEARGIEVTAHHDVSVEVFAHRTATTGGYRAWAEAALDTEYVVWAGPPNGASNPSTFVVVGTQDGTQVTITPSADMVAGSDTPSSVLAGVPFSVTLGRLQTLTLEGVSGADLSGTLVVATQPVAVIAGADRTLTGGPGATRVGCVLEQVPPTSAWGTRYIATPSANRLQDGVFKIIGSVDGTTIRRDRIPVATVDRGGVATLIVSSALAVEIDTSAPVLVVHEGPSSNAQYQPLARALTPISRYLRSQRVARPPSAHFIGPTGDPWALYMNVVAPASEVHGLRLNGQPLPPSIWHAVGPAETYAWTWFALDASTTEYVVSHMSGAVAFTVEVYGHSVAALSAFALGGGWMRTGVTPACVGRAMTTGDRVDNDCDGAIDEEWANGMDDDLDGAIDEDNQGGTTGNDSPMITSTAQTLAGQGALYYYPVVAVDPDPGDTLTFSVSGPSGMTIDSATGEVEWIPSAAQAGLDHPVTVSVTDGVNPVVSQSFLVTTTTAVSTTPTIVGRTMCTDGALFIGPKPYLCHTDSAFDMASANDGISGVYLEDFEAAAFGVPIHALGLVPLYRNLALERGVVTGPIPDGPNEYAYGYTYTDSVDCDDGLVDGLVASTSHSWFDLPGEIGFEFDPNALGAYPTSAGLVWTDSGPGMDTLVLQAYGPTGGLLREETVDLTTFDTGGIAGTVAEDRFFGFVDVENGIARLEVRSYNGGQLQGGLEVDHVQYGGCRASEVLLSQVGLNVGSVTYTYSDLHPAGAIVSQSPADTRVVPAGTSVNVVLALGSNHPPTLATPPTLAAQVGQSLSYTLQASDPDGNDTLRFFINDAALLDLGVQVDATTGVLAWTPGPGHVGAHTVQARVEDRGGLSASVTFGIFVTGNNRAPQLAAVPALTVDEGQLLAYDLAATDADVGGPNGDVLTFSLAGTPTPPAGLTVDASSGRLLWIPARDQVGLHTFDVVVQDRSGVQATQTLAVTVNDLPTPPRITSTPVTTAVQDQLYSYQLVVDDPDPAEVLTYALDVSPAGMTIDGAGLIEWAPNASDVMKTFFVAARVSDSTPYDAIQLYRVSVQNVNDPPVITSTPRLVVSQGATYQYDVVASDPDPYDHLAYQLAVGPSGMTISGSGQLRWLATTAGSIPVTVQVSDIAGAGASQVFNPALTVEPDNTPPTVGIQLSASLIDPNQPAVVTVSAAHASGISSRSLTVDGVATTLDAQHQAVLTPSTPGVRTLQATATNGNGVSASTQAYLLVRDSSDTTGPVALISSPADLTVVTAPTDIIGSAEDVNLAYYTLRYARGSKGAFTSFAQGGQSVTNGVLGTFDPTLLENGLYRVELEVVDVNGATTTDEITVKVEGSMKVGVFSLAFNDLQVPLGGLPITVTRTYDSRVKTKEDFGVGWDLSVSAGEFTHNRPLAEGWTALPQQPISWSTAINGLFIPCVSRGLSNTFELAGKAHTTEVRLSDAEIYRFTPDLINGGRAGGGCLWDVTYTQVDGLPGATLDVVGNATVWYQFSTTTLYDDTSLAPFDPPTLRLTTYDGRTYFIDKDKGVRQVETLAQDKLLISDTGVVKLDAAGNTVESISFARDAQGRISQVQSPGGAVLQYVYDSNGDLAAFVDAAGHRTDFTYDSHHNLQDILDPLGNRAIRNEYDPQGRLTATVDATGHRMTFNHDLASRRETLTDRQGFTYFFDYDPRGNVVTETYPGHGSISRSYDSRDNLLTETDEVGVTTTWGYDAYDRRTSEQRTVSGRPVTRTWAYDSRGNVTAETDPVGNTVISVYDVASRLVSRTEPGNGGAGFTSTYVHDGLGNLTRTCDPAGACRTMAYNARGQVNSEVDERGISTAYGFDVEGRMTTQTMTRTAAGGGTESLVTTYHYDARGLQTKMDGPDGSTTETRYDARGLMTARIDQLGRTTAYAYDVQGHRTLVRNPDQTTEVTAYDLEGRMTARTDRMGRTRVTGYDARGRMTAMSFDGASTVYAYDAAGRLTASTDRRGFTTTQAYDEAGRVTETRSPEHASTQYPTRSSLYDDAGRLTESRDAKNRVTTYAYDAQGQLTLTTYPDATTESSGYDSLGRVTSKVDRGGTEVRHGYDAVGNLTSVTNVGAAETWVYAYDEQNNLTTITDPNGHTRTFAFDAQGRETSRRFHIGPAQTRAYDERGNLTRRSMYDISYGTGATQFSYDSQDRLTRRDQADGAWVAFTYWPNGQRKTATDVRGGVTRYYYDAQDRLTHYEQPDGTSLSYAYDSAGHLTARTADVLTARWTDGYSYDTEGRITTVTAENPFTQTTEAYGLGYDATGQLTSLAYPNGLTTTYGYDPLDQLTRIRISDAAQAVVEQWDYARQADGNIGVITNLDGSTQTYGYDPADRLTSEVVRDAQSVLVHTRTYEYDPAGNRTRVTYTPTSGVGTFDRAASYDARDRLQTDGSVTFTWDEDGRMLSRSGSEGYTLYWDSEDRLTQVDYADGTVAQHAYDSDGVLVETLVVDAAGVSETTAHLVDTQRALSHIVADLDGVGGLVAGYSRFGDMLLGRAQAGGGRYYHGDQIGSVRHISDDVGAFAGSYGYTPYGVLATESGEAASGYLFAGERFGTPGKLSQNRARWMVPDYGLFVSQDPWAGRLVSPQSLGRYAYAHSSPIDGTDPTGAFLASLTPISPRPELAVTLQSAVLGAGGAAIGAGRAVGAAAELTLKVGALTMATVLAIKAARARGEKRRGISVLIPGNDTPATTAHIIGNQLAMPLNRVLTRTYRFPTEKRDWYDRVYSLCAHRGAAVCDEYPFWSTREGGPENYPWRVSLFPVPSDEGPRQGGRLGGFYASCRIAEGEKFIVAPTLFLPTTWWCGSH
jgi:RHS repeat-associated protein